MKRKPLQDNNSGIVMVTVLMIIMVAMVLTVSVISVNVSQVMTTEDEVRRLQAQEYAKGIIFWKVAFQQYSPGYDEISFPDVLPDGTELTVKVNLKNNNNGPANTDEMSVEVTY